MEEYMNELFAVELPCLEIAEVAKGTVVVNSVCMSLENIKLVHEILFKNMESLKKINETFMRCVDRVQFLLLNEKLMDIFRPRESNFQCRAMDSSGAVASKDFQGAIHYILFQEVKTNEPKEETAALEKWQQCLVLLLLETDLTSYCNKVANAPATVLSKENPLRELFWQIHKAPAGFLIDSNKGGQVKVTAYFLSKYFEDIKGKNLLTDFNKLRDYYQQSVQEFLEEQQRLEQSLHVAINSLTNRIAGIESRIGANSSNVYQCMLARRILNDYSCWYEITQDCPSTSRKLFQRSNTMAIGKSSNAYKYVINLEELKKPGVKKKKGPQKPPRQIAE
eukprot:TRINITY_DN2030_c0_g1_i4.p2 TRINITY_DN2030_c0_g1~~TRINITY_DN2030_c0_g1_i4.p2  ORF type:complete len:336 (+),score=86.10 TRINITY_DN2030_c0_g1_i4:1297-2304(+)